MKPRRRVVIVGHGRMAGALKRSLAARGHRCRQVYARGVASQGVFRRGGDDGVAWVLAVPDGSIPAVLHGLVPGIRKGDVVLHLAGMLGPEVLALARSAGASVAAMHPLAAVASARSTRTLQSTVFLVEGDPLARAQARRIARAVGGTVIVATVTDRGRYHGSAALVATGAVALSQGAAWMLSTAFASAPTEQELRVVVASLLRSVASNVEEVGVERALASPLLRNDVTSVARHLAAMTGDPTVRELYRAAIARVLFPLAGEPSVTPETLAAARALVGEKG